MICDGSLIWDSKGGGGEEDKKVYEIHSCKVFTLMQPNKAIPEFVQSRKRRHARRRTSYKACGRWLDFVH